jgi:hypothetical protein
MAVPKCPVFINYLILGIGILMASYIVMIYVPRNGIEGFEDSIAMVAKGAGNPCQEDSDCVSHFCARVDDNKKTCY